MAVKLVDTHAHLDFPELAQDLPSVLERASRAGVYRIVTIGIDLESSRKAVELAEAHEHIHATVGIHPHGARRLDEGTLDSMRRLAACQKVVALGEIGLDYYRDRQPRPAQRECFQQQVELACELGLTAVFHVRDAHEDFLRMIAPHAGNLRRGVLHCFSGDWAVAEVALGLGFYLSIPGTVTYPKAEAQQEVARRCPMDRLLVETDAPFLAPVPFRGKDNEPAHVLYTAQKIAQLRRCSLDEVARHTTRNALDAFGISDTIP
ncbi:MAG: TatD family hydrolase [Syntrophobacteraceae bacterium]|jgi:TatD DNase family protein|nr:TatD family hydrolase [Syntrophobacteraceae bacterium]